MFQVLYSRVCAVRRSVHRRRAREDPRRAGHLRPRHLHRLPLLHDRLPLRDSEVQLGRQGSLRPEVQPLLRAGEERGKAAGLHGGLSGTYRSLKYYFGDEKIYFNGRVRSPG